jgi:exopolysaccharide biosynthesis polyprenyl glycosylphosphotransferase
VGYVKMDDEVVTNDFLVLGSMTQLDEIMQRQPIHSVIIAADTLEEPDLYAIINRLMKYDVDIQFPPRSFEILTGRVRLYDIDSTPVVTLTQPSMAAWQQSVKRVFDILMSLFALVLFFPIMVYVAVRVKRDSPGPIFYKQERIGKDGHPFYMYKFRTMYVGAEQNGPQLSSQNDERITPFGAIMRKYRLDELPQFWNILKGDMSVVGPRPERRYFINQIEEKAPYYCLIYKIQPGLLSWGPIKIGYSDTVEKMVERLNYDIIYMDNMTLLNDLKIMIYSLEVIIKGRGM